MGEIEQTTMAELASESNHHHRECERAANAALEHAMAAGEKLGEAKARLNHGEFGAWLETNFEGSPRMAQRYMRLYDRREELEAKTTRVSDLSLRGALGELEEQKENEGGGEDQAGGDDLSDGEVSEIVGEAVKAWAPAITDIEWGAVESRLSSVGEAERLLLRDLNVNSLLHLAAQAHVEGFFFECGQDGMMFLSYRDEEIRWVPLPTDDEALREIVRRGARQYALYEIKNIRRIGNWLTHVVAAEAEDMDTIERRAAFNRDWRPAEVVADYLWDWERDKPGHTKADYEKNCHHPELAFDQLVEGLEVWLKLCARRVENYVFGEALEEGDATERRYNADKNKNNS